LGGELTLLHLGLAPCKVVEALGARLGPVHGEGKIVVLEVEAHAGEVNKGLDARAAELDGVA
jgi:hypothetical protein